jgi:integrase
MLSLIPAASTSPLFVVPGKKKLIPITYRKLQMFLKDLIKTCGRDPDSYSSHSFRRGGATWAFQSRVPSDLIQLHGDWASDAYKKYLHFPLGSKLLVVTRMGHAIQKLHV